MVESSTFGERFVFARLWQELRGEGETDTDFAGAIGVSSSSVTLYKAIEDAPPASRVLAMARRLGVDPGWLSHGSDSAAPAPDGFDVWLAKRRVVVDRRPEYQRIAEQHGRKVAEGGNPRDLLKGKEKGAGATKRRRA